MDIVTALLLASGAFSAVTGKVAARKRRLWLWWCLYGAVLGPVALMHALLSPVLAPCPSCGRNIHIKPGHACKYCGWAPPPPVKNSAVVSDIAQAAGFGLGDTLKSAEKKLKGAGVAYEISSDTGGDGITCEARDIFGFPAIASGALLDGRVAEIALSYPPDTDYKIYYCLRTLLVSKYGKPECERRESGQRDVWRAKKTEISLETEPTRVVYGRADS